MEGSMSLPITPDKSSAAASAAYDDTNGTSVEDDNRKQNGTIDGIDRLTIGQRLQARLDSFARDNGTAAAPPPDTSPEQADLPGDQQQNESEEASSRRRRSSARNNTRRSTRGGPSLTQPPPRSYRLRTRDQKRPRRQERPPPNAFAIEVQQFEQQHAYPGAYSVTGMMRNAPGIGDHHSGALESSEEEEDEGSVTGKGYRQKIIWISIAVMVVVIIAVVVIVVVMSVPSNSNSIINTTTTNDEEINNNTTTSIIDDGVFSKWIPYMKQLSDDKSVFNDVTSPQSKALYWFVYEDSISNTVATENNKYITQWIAEILKSRYLLALLYFATTGEGSGGNVVNKNNTIVVNNNDGSWREKYHFLSPLLHVCNWTSTTTTDQDDNNNNNNDWGNKKQGVICNDNFEVTGIVMEGNGLRGILPQELIHLKHLEVLRLRNNELYGHPSYTASSSQLKILDLSVNQFTGDLSALLSGKLIELNVSHNFFDGHVLEESAALLFTSIFENSEELEILDLSNCSFSGEIMSTNIEPFINLQTFRFDDNSFTGTLPSRLLHLLPALSVISGSGNQLTGTFPWPAIDTAAAAAGPSSLLRQVDMSNNLFSSVFPPLAAIFDSASSTMEYMDFSNNLIVSTIPESVGQLSMLKNLLVANNQITGTIPSTLGDLTVLQTLDVSQNQIEGTIPSELTQCVKLENLLLHNNLLSGNIPEGFAKMPLLDLATFHGNNFLGDIGFFCSSMSSSSSQVAVGVDVSIIRNVTADCLGDSPKVECVPPTCCECRG